MSFRSTIVPLLLMLGSLAGCDKQDSANTQAEAAAPADNIAAAPIEKPATGTLDRSHKGEAPPSVGFTAPDGKTTTIAAFKGKPVLVNLWATWCAPCIAEMPTLDRAAQALAGKVAVVALNQGDDAAKVQAFLTTKPLAHARPLLDKAMAVSLTLSANLPTTILYDATGHELWRATGGRDWASPASLKLIGEAG